MSISEFLCENQFQTTLNRMVVWLQMMQTNIQTRILTKTMGQLVNFNPNRDPEIQTNENFGDDACTFKRIELDKSLIKCLPG